MELGYPNDWNLLMLALESRQSPEMRLGRATLQAAGSVPSMAPGPFFGEDEDGSTISFFVPLFWRSVEFGVLFADVRRVFPPNKIFPAAVDGFLGLLHIQTHCCSLGQKVNVIYHWRICDDTKNGVMECYVGLFLVGCIH